MMKYYFIVNLTSRTGKARKIWIEVERELKRQKVDYEAYMTEYGGHGRELANALCTRAIAACGLPEEPGKPAAAERLGEPGPEGAMEPVAGAKCLGEPKEPQSCLVVVGGDGTANEVINGMHHFEEILFGYIPTGSGNDLGRGLGISREPLLALQGIMEAKEVFPMDLGRVTDGEGNSHYFNISSGIGIDADVCRMALSSRLKKFLNFLGLGSLTYVILTIKALFTMPTTEVTASFDGGEKRKISKMIFVAGMNHPWEGGGVPMAPGANSRDGKLSVCCVYGIPRLKAFFLLPVLVQGKHEGLKGFEVVNCKSYELRLETPMVLHADGEYLGRQQVIRYECEKGKLLVRKLG